MAAPSPPSSGAQEGRGLSAGGGGGKAPGVRTGSGAALSARKGMKKTFVRN
jgi:hypothetical protein